MRKHFFAHSLPGRSVCEWQDLEDHLRNVARSAKEFAEPFGSGDWGYAAGLLHDIGKYSDEFQQMLIRASDEDTSSEFLHGPDHSSAGAQEINKRVADGLGKLLAYAIAGHHSGLLDGKSNDACLEKRLSKEIPNYSSCAAVIVEAVPKLQLPDHLKQKESYELIAFRLQLFVRMIFSCLVDADRLDTEAFHNAGKAALRQVRVSLGELRGKVLEKIGDLQRKAERGDMPCTVVNRKRREVSEQCMQAAQKHPGIFSLTVPTGGGKTLSSLAFALEHAVKYGKGRVIYVIPYTSIIEQNAKVFRDVCGDDAVVEHHSNFEFTEDSYRAQLASENWDAPLIVTTNVQFFETLFSSRTSRCRKAHNIANSVVIFDEAQMLPIELLKPCMAVIQELVRSYGVTAVLCSATQPALARSEEFTYGIEGIREIISDPVDLYLSLRRVEVRTASSPMSDAEVAALIDRNRRVLCVVNTRRQARRLYELVGNREGLYHLSGLMCPAHRSQVLERIRAALENDEPCRVVSTQLVEAGVDVDFPVVLRALSGIDSIAQAAGRCNREGKLAGGGSVLVFAAEDASPPGHLRRCAEEAQGIIRNHDDILSLEAVREYFGNLYWRQGEGLDKHGILARIAEGIGSCDFPFRTVGGMFRIIEDGTRTIVIPFDKEARSLINEMKNSDSKDIARKLQRYCVQVYPNVIEKLGRAAIEPMHERYYVLINDHLYKKSDIGLDWDDPYFRDVEGNIF
jgi:CRISPR-associated endonuclease/helicase Cas3